MAKSKRNFLLEMIEGPRTYVPPPNTMILELMDQEKTKGGLLLPEARAAEQAGSGMKPLGRVIFVAQGRDTWKDDAAPAAVGDYVLFTPEMYPVIDIHDNMVVIHFDTVMLRIVGFSPGESGPPRGIYYEPDEEEPLYKYDEKLTLVLE